MPLLPPLQHSSSGQVHQLSPRCEIIYSAHSLFWIPDSSSATFLVCPFLSFSLSSMYTSCLLEYSTGYHRVIYAARENNCECNQTYSHSFCTSIVDYLWQCFTLSSLCDGRWQNRLYMDRILLLLWQMELCREKLGLPVHSSGK
jgi:hypothetical protein